MSTGHSSGMMPSSGRDGRRRSRSRSRERDHHQHQQQQQRHRRRSRSRDRGGGGHRQERDAGAWVKGQALLRLAEEEEDGDAAVRRLLPRTSAKPTASVLLTGLSPTTTEAMIGEALARYYPTAIRLFRHPHTGGAVAAQLEFPGPEFATSLVTAFGPTAPVPLLIDTHMVENLEYCIPITAGAGSASASTSRPRSHSHSSSGHSHSHKRSRSHSRSRSQSNNARGGRRRSRSRSWSRDREKERERGRRRGEGKGGGGKEEQDWVCGQCHKLNYGRRADCCQCGRAKGPDALYPPHLYDDRDGGGGGGRREADEGALPRATLIVKGLPFHSNEASLAQALAALGVPVLDCRLARDPISSASRGFGYVELGSVEAAEHVLRQSLGLREGLEVEGRPVRVAFATDSFAALVGPTTTSTANPTLCSGASIAAAADPATATAVPSVVAKPRPEWPPSFEEGGAAYVRDARSGFFWHGASGFYHDPVSRLYYSTRQQAYYTLHDPAHPEPARRWRPFAPPLPAGPPPECVAYTAAAPVPVAAAVEAAPGPYEPPPPEQVWPERQLQYYQRQHLQPVQEPHPQQPSGYVPATVTPAAVPVAAGERRPTVSISLKPRPGAKRLGAAAAAGGEAAGAWAAGVEEEEEDGDVDMGVEEDGGASAAASQMQPPPRPAGVSSLPTLSNDTLLLAAAASDERAMAAAVAASAAAAAAAGGGKGRRGPGGQQQQHQQQQAPASGEPVCLLCRRAFDSLEQLRKHEAKSKLHAENLAKARQAAGGAGAGAYRDRASERRQIYGQDDEPKSLRQEERRARQQREHEQRGGRRYHNAPPAPAPVAAAAASVDKSILEDEGNLGSRMLLGMGYRIGEGLGKDGAGIVEPVRAAGAQAAADKGGVGARGGAGGAPPLFLPGARGREVYESAEMRAAMARARYEASSLS